MQISRLRTSLCALAALGVSTLAALADPMTVTDIAGRQITFDELPQNIVLGEGRMMYAIAPLVEGNPLEKIVGWKSDLVEFDPGAFRRYEAAFPEDTARMFDFGTAYPVDFSLETLLEIETDLLLLHVGNLHEAQEVGLIDKLEAAGVQVAFVDFRRNPTENTVPSLLLLGRLLGAEKRTAEFIDFYIGQMRKVTNIAHGIDQEDRPLVVIENAAGWDPEFCCWSYGPYNYGRFVELAGGVNYGSKISSVESITISLEGIIEADPDHIIGTSANWSETKPEVISALMGYDVDPQENVQRLQGLADRTGFSELRAVKDGNLHAMYYHFYTSPYHFVAVQQIAKWLHPEEFKDLDPQASLDELHERFLPFSTSGQFWATLN